MLLETFLQLENFIIQTVPALEWLFYYWSFGQVQKKSMTLGYVYTSGSHPSL